MNQKPVLYREKIRKIVTLNSDAFEEKKLCDALTFNLGDACAYSCEYCYVEAQMLKLDKPIIDAKNQTDGRTAEEENLLAFRDVVIRRRDALKVLYEQLVDKKGRKVYNDPNDNRVIYSSTLVDVAANKDLLEETAKACNLILNNTHWQIRLLSKSNMLHHLIEKKLIPEKHHQRLIFGVSAGTLDDKVAAAIETGTAKVSARLKSLEWLQDNGLRTFGMICPSLPQGDYEAFSKDMCAAIRVDKCEHVWAEVINVRGASMIRTLGALRQGGFDDMADRVAEIGDPDKWEAYARATFQAHAANIPVEKYRFLQYVDKKSIEWWNDQIPRGALVLGKVAQKALCDPVPKLETEDAEYKKSREEVVEKAVSASIEAAKALREIKTYKDGILWKSEFKTFEAYCSAKWGYQKSHAYRLVESGEFVAQLQAYNTEHSPGGESIALPVNESQIRAITAVPKEQRVAAWVEGVGTTAVDDLTAKAIAERVKDYLPPKTARTRGAAAAPQPMIMADNPTGPDEALATLEASVGEHPKVTEIKTLIAQIKALLSSLAEEAPSLSAA